MIPALEGCRLFRNIFSSHSLKQDLMELISIAISRLPSLNIFQAADECNFFEKLDVGTYKRYEVFIANKAYIKLP